ncbi:hypothetical protein QVD17_04543 [Tagetes erecta]|uniref:Uncharacterized protein n=1 Tax=Tagetes erecta TaxID=13708 RepID=A0AAD8LCX4_TARER|nr:hypothetical protein QVD17_04543 [Tagetes erecta]
MLELGLRRSERRRLIKDAISAGPKWFCSRHGVNDEARYKYRLNDVIIDVTGNINAIIYDEVILEMVGESCKSS